MTRIKWFRLDAYALIPAVLIFIFLTGCKADLSVENIMTGYNESTKLDGITITYPFDGAVFPPEIVSPTFRWDDTNPKCDVWLATVKSQNGARTGSVVRAKEWKPTLTEWEEMKKRSLDNPLEVVILGVSRSSPKKILSGGKVAIRTSKDEVGASVFYRDVNLPFNDAVRDPSDIRWRFGAVSSPEMPPVVLEKLPICGNCHSFSRDGKVLGMDVDYASDKGSYAIVPVTPEVSLTEDKVITWSDYKRDEAEPTFGLLSQVSPDGNFAVSTVKDRSVFVSKPEIPFSQLFFPLKGILCVYDKRTKEFKALPGADDPKYVQSNPTWSPDGKYIVFARSEAYQLKNLDEKGQVLLTDEECREFLKDGKTFLFDLYRIPFNEGLGGTPEPIPGASQNGMSNFFARYSPDGKWIVFCKAKSFMLLQPDSELYIMLAEGGVPRKLECNTSLMNSWHSWSPNSRWLVFSSKVFTPYTQLFLTHIDETGHSTPPVLLENFVGAQRAANIPEFVDLEPSDLKKIREDYITSGTLVKAGDVSVKVGDIPNAVRYFRMAVEADPKSAVAHLRLALALDTIDEVDEATTHYTEALRINPNLGEAHLNLGLKLVVKGEFQKALPHLSKAAALMPENSSAQFNLGRAMYQIGNVDAAIRYTREAVRIKPDYVDAQVNLGGYLLDKKMFEESLSHSTEAIRLDPKSANAYNNLGEVQVALGRLDEAAESYSKALAIEPKKATSHIGLARIMVFRGNVDDGLKHYVEALKAEPSYAADPSIFRLLKDSGATKEQINQAVGTATKVAQWARAAGRTDLADSVEQMLAESQ